MLLSMNASYHWAKINKKAYLLRMTVFIILVSFLSAFLASWGILYGFVTPALSFPFYAFYGEMHGSPIPPLGYSDWIPTYSIHFLTMEISSLKPQDSVEYVENFGWRYQLLGYHVIFLNMEIGVIVVKYLMFYALTFPLLFFIVVNIVGAILGYKMSEMHRIQEWGTNKRWNSLGLILGFVFLGIGFWLSNIGVVKTGRNPPWGEYYNEYAVTLYPYRGGGIIFFLFGIIVLGIVIGRLLSKYWQLDDFRD